MILDAFSANQFKVSNLQVSFNCFRQKFFGYVSSVQPAFASSKCCILSFSASQSFFIDVRFGKYFVYQVPVDCNHEHTN